MSRLRQIKVQILVAIFVMCGLLLHSAYSALQQSKKKHELATAGGLAQFIVIAYGEDGTRRTSDSLKETKLLCILQEFSLLVSVIDNFDG